MRLTLACILTFGFGLASVHNSLGQACPQGCQSQIDNLQKNWQNIQATAPKIKTFSGVAVPQIGGAPSVPWVLSLNDFWKDILSIQVTVGDNVMSLPFTGDMWHEGMTWPATSQVLLGTCGNPAGHLTAVLSSNPRVLSIAASDCRMTAEVTLLLKR